MVILASPETRVPAKIQKARGSGPLKLIDNQRTTRLLY
jgi:hypothetical protein